MAKPNKNAPLGQGGRFAYVEQQAAKSGASNPAAVAAAVVIPATTGGQVTVDQIKTAVVAALTEHPLTPKP